MSESYSPLSFSRLICIILSTVELFRFVLFRIHRNLIGLRFFSLPEAVGDKKDAEASKIVTSPYKRTAEAIFGGRKSENIKLLAGIRQDSDPLSALWDILKANNFSLFSLFRSALF